MIPLYFGMFDRVQEGVHVPSRKGSVDWNSSKSLFHFIIHIWLSVQELKKGRRFFVQLIKNLFVQSIETVIQLVKGKLCISQGFNEQSANKLFVGGKVSGSSFFNNVSILVHGVVVISILGQLGLAQKNTARFYIFHRNCPAPNLILTPCQRHPLSRHCSIHIGSNRAVHSIFFSHRIRC